MTLEGAMFTLLQLSLMANWPVALFLTYQAYRKPRVMALVVMAVATWLIALGLTAYVLAVVNAQLLDYAIPRETAQVLFRAVLLGLALFPLWFLWLYATRRFRDGVHV